ncbi:hypothetical protein [Cellulomonas endophytica]|uniref:hypothetical protein n=1 Tax=Cellulomonas endophytica TaxID=2494735 RepID=UPI0013E92453|nr:hypothetical protein [Cellulomonas endophytica]
MTSRKSLASAAAAAALLAAGLTAAPAAAAPGTIGDLWQVEWSGALFDVYSDEGVPVAVQLTYDEWVDLGRPAPDGIAPVEVYRAPWSRVVSAVAYFGDPADPETTFLAEALTFSDWQSIGAPDPAVEVYPGSGFLQWGTSAEVFGVDPGSYTKLSYDQWSDLGRPEPEVQADMGVAKLSWDPGIAYMTSLEAGQGTPLAYAEWSELAMPTPLVVTSFPGETVYRIGSGSTVYYAGPTVNRALTFAEWTALGRPTPERR